MPRPLAEIRLPVTTSSRKGKLEVGTSLHLKRSQIFCSNRLPDTIIHKKDTRTKVRWVPKHFRVPARLVELLVEPQMLLVEARLERQLELGPEPEPEPELELALALERARQHLGPERRPLVQPEE
jgi:hypothetical protein